MKEEIRVMGRSGRTPKSKQPLVKRKDISRDNKGREIRRH